MGLSQKPVNDLMRLKGLANKGWLTDKDQIPFIKKNLLINHDVPTKNRGLEGAEAPSVTEDEYTAQIREMVVDVTSQMEPLAWLTAAQP